MIEADAADPRTTRAWAWCLALVLCLAADLALLGGVLFDSSVRAPGDIAAASLPWREELPGAPERARNPLLFDWIGQVHPWRAQVADAWSSGRAPLWDELSGFGQPLLANALSEPLSPYLPVALLAGEQHSDWKQLAQLLVAQLLCLGLARWLGLGAPAGAALALSFSFCSYIQLWGCVSHGGTAAFAPGALWAFLALRAAPSARRVALAALTVALAVFSGHVETAFLLAFTACSTAFLRPAPGGRSRLAFAGLALAAGALGLLASAAVLMPLFDYLDQSDIVAFRIEALRLTGGHFLGPRHLLSLLDPTALGGPRDWRGDLNMIEAHIHVGRVAIALAAGGLVAGFLRRERRGLALALVATAFLALFVACAPEGLRRHILEVPPFDRQTVARMWFAAELPLALLAALGLDALTRGGALPVVFAAALVLIGGVFGWLSGALAPTCLPWIAAVPLLAGLTRIAAPRGLFAILPAFLLAALVALDAVSFWRGFVPEVPAAWMTPRSATIEALRARAGEDQRALPLGPLAPPNLSRIHGLPNPRVYDPIGLRGHAEVFKYPVAIPSAVLDVAAVRWVATLWPAERVPRFAGQVVAGAESSEAIPFLTDPEAPVELLVESLDGRPLESAAYLEVTGPEDRTLRLGIGAARDADESVADFGAIRSDPDGAMREFLALLGPGRERGYLRFDAPRAGIPVSARVRVDPGAPPVVVRSLVRGALGPCIERERIGRVRIVERPTALPRVFLAARATPVPSLEAAVERIVSPGFDPRRETLVEWRGADAATPPAVRDAILPLAARRPAPEVLEIDVETEAAALVVIADAHARGWRAELDGEEVPIHVTNGFGRGVLVPAGRRVLRLEYRPEAWTRGRLVSAVALLALGLALVVGGRRR